MQDYYTKAIEKTERRMLKLNPTSQNFTVLNNLLTKLRIQQSRQAPTGTQRSPNICESPVPARFVDTQPTEKKPE